MSTMQGVTKPNADTTWTLLCGKAMCPEVARFTVEVEWPEHHWIGVFGACSEHREDIGLMVLKARESAGS